MSVSLVALDAKLGSRAHKSNAPRVDRRRGSCHGFHRLRSSWLCRCLAVSVLAARLIKYMYPTMTLRSAAQTDNAMQPASNRHGQLLSGLLNTQTSAYAAHASAEPPTFPPGVQDVFESYVRSKHRGYGVTTREAARQAEPHCRS